MEITDDDRRKDTAEHDDATSNAADSSTSNTTTLINAITSNNSNINLPSNRFALELEFLQCLASPAYLHYLATTGLLSDTKFIAFLKYLQSYWTTPEYARFVIYPHAFYFLDQCIHNDNFRREMANVGFRNFVHEQQFYAWQYRSKHLYGTGLLDEAGNKNNNNNATAAPSTTTTEQGPETPASESNKQKEDGTPGRSTADQSSDEDSDSAGNVSEHDEDDEEEEDSGDVSQPASF